MVDGDTIDVNIDGQTVPVRYIGVDTAEMGWSGAPSECSARDATDENRRLVEGRTVRLVVGEEPYDRYDRLLAYVYTGKRMVNAELLRAGLAETLTIPPNDRYAGRFEEIEEKARESSAGRWGYCRP